MQFMSRLDLYLVGWPESGLSRGNEETPNCFRLLGLNNPREGIRAAT